jgi:hypothetical protein
MSPINYMRWSTKFNKGQLPKRKSFDKKNLFDRKTKDKTSIFNLVAPKELINKIRHERRLEQIKQIKVTALVFLLLTIALIYLGFLYLS